MVTPLIRLAEEPKVPIMYNYLIIDMSHVKRINNQAKVPPGSIILRSIRKALPNCAILACRIRHFYSVNLSYPVSLANNMHVMILFCGQ